jgi:thioredoxin 1
MKKIIILFLLFNLSLFAYDFGAVPQVRVNKIVMDRPMMILVGKTECIWCESMAPQLKEIKEQYPKTTIYYVNTDKDPMWAIKHNILELPVQLFLDKDGKEIGRNIGYIGHDDILSLLEESGVLVKE